MFDDEFRLVISNDLRQELGNRVLREAFQPFEGAAMRLPDRFRPDAEFCGGIGRRFFRCGMSELRMDN